MKNYQEFLENKGEEKWQKVWKKKKFFQTPKDVTPENKYYILDMFPYPSGSGLHVGHVEGYTATDMMARYQKMRGKKVLHPMGWDAFGLPAENYAIKTGVHPDENTKKAVTTFKEQMSSIGFIYDWDREINTSDPNYYKWTQWFFLLFYKRGLAYRKKQAVNWCKSCKTVLANDQVKEGHCERCDTEIIQKDMEQWYIKVTEYADRLLEGLDKLDWPEETKKRQKDWIGRSEGASVSFTVKNVRTTNDYEHTNNEIEVFTTRPDTLFGATYMVLAPEGQYVQDLKENITNWKEVEKYIKKTSKKTELDRQMDKEKTGVELKGVKAINPVNNEEIPIWIADYVMASYGTGAIMAVPAHDERDFEFASKFGLEIKEVVAKKFGEPRDDEEDRDSVYGVIERDGKILVLFEKTQNEYRLPGGGNDDESDDVALLKEIAEETGYADFEIGDYLGTVRSHFFAGCKNVYRARYATGYVVKLISDNQVETEEGGPEFEFHWFEPNEALEKLKSNEEVSGDFEFMQRYINRTNVLHSEFGVSINSDFLDGLDTKEAKSKMIAWLEEKGVGKGKVQYKLRDWSVSRQRFWGAPIPMLENEEIKNKKYNYIFIHGYTGNVDDGFKPWLKEELERQGHRVWSQNLPNTNNPNIDEQVKYIFDNLDFEINENTIIMSHSLGAVVAYKLFERINNKITKVVFVDPVVTDKFNDMDRPGVTNSCDWGFDWKKIRESIDEIIILGDKDYPIIKKEDLELLHTKVGGDLRIVTAQAEHFSNNWDRQILPEPEVLRACEITGLKPVPEEDLPVMLPEDVDFKPTGESPLNYSEEFKNRAKEKYGEEWQYEPDTLDTFMCSSWYYFRYLDPKNNSAFASPEALKKWMPVDFYLGGPEHVNGHLLYSRFFTKVLFDEGLIGFDEPFKTLRHQGLILGPDNRKMSKRWGNVVNPTDVVNEYGADTCRMYEMFMGPLEDDKPWSENGVKGVRRFLDKVWKLQEKIVSHKSEGVSDIDKLTHKTIKKVTEDLDTLGFNTAIARMMELVNVMSKEKELLLTPYSLLLKMLTPFAPHIAEELWNKLGNKDSICEQSWPEYDPELVKDDEVTLVVQINGKLRGEMTVPADISEEDAKTQALQVENVAKWLDGKEPKKVIYVKGKLVSIVV